MSGRCALCGARGVDFCPGAGAESVICSRTMACMRRRFEREERRADEWRTLAYSAIDTLRACCNAIESDSAAATLVATPAARDALAHLERRAEEIRER